MITEFVTDVQPFNNLNPQKKKEREAYKKAIVDRIAGFNLHRQTKVDWPSAGVIKFWAPSLAKNGFYFQCDAVKNESNIELQNCVVSSTQGQGQKQISVRYDSSENLAFEVIYKDRNSIPGVSLILYLRYLVQIDSSAETKGHRQDLLNRHAFTEQGTYQFSKDDHLGVNFTPENANSDLFFIRRWAPEQLPIEISLHSSTDPVKNWIEDAVAHVNEIAHKNGIGNTNTGVPSLIRLKPTLHTGTAVETDIDDLHTHLVKISDRSLDLAIWGLAQVQSSAKNDAQIIDGDITLYWPHLLNTMKSRRPITPVEEKRMFQSVFLHELLHLLGLSHNFLGKKWGSLMDYYSAWDWDHAGDEMPILPFQLDSPYDIWTLKYSYGGNDSVSAEDIQDYFVLRNSPDFDIPPNINWFKSSALNREYRELNVPEINLR